MGETLVLLHGFSGTRHAWDGVVARLEPQRYRPLALNLPGHGDAAAAALAGEPVTFESCAAAVLDAAPARFALCGYSLGGRVALHVALAAPERVSRLALVSTSAGIEDAAERAARGVADRRHADELERVPFEDFIERWRAQPLFADEPPDVGESAREEMRRNDPRALAAAMRGVGAGEMAPLWSRLHGLPIPVLVVAGERDAKYRALAERMVALLPDASLVVIPGGHALALESPGELARALNER